MGCARKLRSDSFKGGGNSQYTFFGALAGCSARRSERSVASHTSEEPRRNAPARAAKNGILAFSASLSLQANRIEREQ